MSTNKRVPFYHYTTEEGQKAILRDGHIRASDPSAGDARFGRGSYGTNLPPSTRPREIAKNNWDGGWSTAIKDGKLDRYLRCEVPVGELTEHSGSAKSSRGRILLHPSGIDISKYPTKYGIVGKDSVPWAAQYNSDSSPGACTPDRTKRTPRSAAQGNCTTPLKPPRPGPVPGPISGGAYVPVGKIAGMYKGGPGTSSPYPDRASSICGGHAFADDSSDGERITEVMTLVADEGSREIDHSGHNEQGNYYESYTDGSYHYENQNGSTYDRDADGHATYTSPNGDAYENDVADAGGGYDGDEGYGGDGGCDWRDDDDGHGGCDDWGDDDHDYW